MTDWHDRIDKLPPGLRDGSWAQCALCIRGSRLHFQEMAEAVDERRRHAQRRRLALFIAGLLVTVASFYIRGAGSQAATGIVAALLLLGAVDGAARDMRRHWQPFDLAVIDARHEEVSLVGPDGTGLSMPYSEVSMFLLVADPATGVFHVGVVLRSGLFLPWLHTHGALAGISLAYLLGYATDRPARKLAAAVPFPLEAIEQAAPIDPPAAPFG